MTNRATIHKDGKKFGVTLRDGQYVAATLCDGFLLHDEGYKESPWNLTMPCGMTLGRYHSRNHARLASAMLAPKIKNWNAETLEDIFGGEDQASAAYEHYRQFQSNLSAKGAA